MSVLLVPAPGRLDVPVLTAVVERLLAQGDEVRVVMERSNHGIAEGLRLLGAHVAVGEPSSTDLIDRAAQNARTVVVIDTALHYDLEVLDAAIEGGGFASVNRLVFCGAGRDEEVTRRVHASGMGFVLLWTGRRRRLLGRGVAEQDIAEAIDAADDVAGDPGLDLDLTEEGSWAHLGLSPPRNST